MSVDHGQVRVEDARIGTTDNVRGDERFVRVFQQTDQPAGSRGGTVCVLDLGDWAHVDRRRRSMESGRPMVDPPAADLVNGDAHEEIPSPAYPRRQAQPLDLTIQSGRRCQMDAPTDREHTPTFTVDKVLSVDLESRRHAGGGPIEIATLLNTNEYGLVEQDVVDGKDGRMVTHDNCDSTQSVFS